MQPSGCTLDPRGKNMPRDLGVHSSVRGAKLYKGPPGTRIRPGCVVTSGAFTAVQWPLPGLQVHGSPKR